MHAAEREKLIVQLVRDHDFVSFRELDRLLASSPATIRRDLERLAGERKVDRVRGGVRAIQTHEPPHLSVSPFSVNIARNRAAKAAIGAAAAALCAPGETIIIDGGSTTFHICPHLAALGLHVITNSLHIVNSLLPQQNTQVSMPSGALFREQNILLSPFEDDGLSRYRASRMFMGAASIGPHGLMQTDAILTHAERRLMERADEIVALIDSTKFAAPAGHVVAELGELDALVTDDKISDKAAAMIEAAGIRLITVKTAIAAQRAARPAHG